MPDPCYSDEELSALGLGGFGEGVRIHRSVLIFNPARLFLGSHTRIDCFSLLSAGPEGIHIGDHVHLAASVFIFGGGGRVTIGDFAGLSSRVAVYTASDDYSGEYLTNPTVPDAFKNVDCAPVSVGRHAIVGAGSVIMPGASLGTGAAVGALSFVNRPVGEFLVVVGRPAKVVGKRHQGLLDKEREFLASGG